MYGKVMSLPDDVMGNYFRLVTRWTPKEIDAIESQLSSGEMHPRDAKMALAREIVEAFYGAEEAREAEDAFRRIFQQGDVPEDMPEHTLTAGESILDLLVKTKLASSRSEGRRLIEQRGVRLGDEVVEDPNRVIELVEPAILRVGKRKFLRITP
jgi:tyrosyl-tRNA synthetase